MWQLMELMQVVNISISALQYRSTSKVATVVETLGFLLQVELDPVVEAGDVMLTRLSNEHVLKRTRVHRTVFNMKFHLFNLRC